MVIVMVMWLWLCGYVSGCAVLYVVMCVFYQELMYQVPKAFTGAQSSQHCTITILER